MAELLRRRADDFSDSHTLNVTVLLDTINSVARHKMPARKKGTTSSDDENSVAIAIATALKSTADPTSTSAELVIILPMVSKLSNAALEDLAERSGRELAKWVRKGLSRASDKGCNKGDIHVSVDVYF